MQNEVSFKQFSPYVRVAMDSLVQPPWHVQEREIWDYEILFLKEGRLLITVEDKVYEGIPGDIFVFKPLQRHSILLLGREPVRQPHVHFDLFELPDSGELTVSFKISRQMSEQERGWFRPDLLSENPLFIPNHIRLRHPERIEAMLFELIDEFQTKLPMYEISCKGLLLSLLAYLIRQNNTNTGVPGPDMQGIRRHLHQHGDREITLDELSDLFKISKYYMVRAFKQHFQMTPIQYHRHIRLDKAKQLLRFSNVSVQHISDQLGFGSIHAFSRAFKTAEDLSPSQYRVQKMS